MIARASGQGFALWGPLLVLAALAVVRRAAAQCGCSKCVGCLFGETYNDCAPDSGGGINEFDCYTESGCLNWGIVCTEGCGYTCEGNYCDSNPCLNGGACDSAYKNYFVCSCSSGYSGATCATNPDDCPSPACNNHGTCTDGVNSYSCDCHDGYQGINCATDIDECASSPCANGGACVDEIALYSCQCADGAGGTTGWSGANCAIEIDPCALEEDDCSADATCAHTGPGTHSCSCFPGYESPNAGVTCTDIDECSPGDHCGNGGTCSALLPDVPLESYVCSCAPGFIGESECTACGAGQYQGSSGQSSCQTCLEGSTTMSSEGALTSSAATICEECEAGTFGTSPVEACVQCPPGSVTNTLAAAGATTCTECPHGHFTTESTVECVICAEGQYQPAPGQTDCLGKSVCDPTLI